ncbi:MAG: hypothetical protein N2Z20_02870, partial [Elusimicrobiales bacterium]|nr:hypothetical protein [Elusimicrobiales bacterium]
MKFNIIFREVIYLLKIALIFLTFSFNIYSADVGTELGAQDDFSVLGVEGNYLDPDVEIKGFTV